MHICVICVCSLLYVFVRTKTLDLESEDIFSGLQIRFGLNVGGVWSTNKHTDVTHFI